MMKTLLFAILIAFSFNSVQSQNCGDFFMDNYKVDTKKITRIIKRELKQNTNQKEALNHYNSINIMLIDAYTRNFDTAKFNKQNLLCYLNLKKVTLREAIIKKDSLPVGILFPWGRGKYELKNINDDYYVFNKELIEQIIDINPDFIFEIENIPEAYWYIKEDKLYTLSFRNSDGKIQDIKIVNPDFFINHLSEEDVKITLILKNRRVISR